MDPFTQRMLERAQSRREKLDNQKLMLNQRSPLQEKFNMNENTDSGDKTSTDNKDNKKEKQFITAKRKSKLQKLAQFYSGNNENIFLEDEEEKEEQEVVEEKQNQPCDTQVKPPCKLGRLNELASKIKQWEDDLQQPKRTIKSPQQNIKALNGGSKRAKADQKEVILNSSMVEKLCSQGFSRSKSQSKLLYDFEKEPEKPKEINNLKKDFFGKSVGPPVVHNKKVQTKLENASGSVNEVLKKAAFFESTTKESPKKCTKDPAELSLAERKALFEKCKGEAVLPKNQLYFERKQPVLRDKWVKKEVQANEKLFFTPSEKPEDKEHFSQQKPLSKKDETVCKEMIVENKNSEKVDIKPSKGNEIPEAPPMPATHEDVMVDSNPIREEKEREPLSPKNGRLYPSLSNLDISKDYEKNSVLTDSFNDSKNSNLCLNMTLSDLLELNKNNPTTPPNDLSFSQSKECQVLNKMDRLLEDALNEFSSSETEEDSDNVNPSPPKMKKSSSFEYKSVRGDANPLLHTVSFYRKQQQNSFLTPEKSCEKVNAEPECSQENVDESILVQNKIQALIAEVNKQQTIISQASQALNLCISTVEFSGSGEQVEGERLLLLASHKRQACLNEIQRLKVENTLLPQAMNDFLTERGDVNLTNISIKLKRDALRSIAAAENLQYFVCLIKSEEQVLATPAVPATKENLKDMALQFPGQIKLENLLSNFKITVEVYNLELSKELLPHEIKYHIINKKEKKLLTPIKSKKSESKLVKPNIQSPAGPNAVRTTNFQMCGYIVFSLKEITRTQWILNKVPYVSPVEGTISMTITSQLRLNDEFRGFLTMFDDISGFGAWHRRWCVLSSHFISYWKYPDDETKKVPIGTIDLRTVITESVGLVSRDICARLNTFLLETTRPRLSDDKDSLVVRVKDEITTIRHLLSADSKQEMSTWCKKLNTALALLRSWKCNSMK